MLIFLLICVNVIVVCILCQIGQSGGANINGDNTENAVDYSAKTHELQTIIEKQTAELSQWQRRVSDLNNKIGDLEDGLSKVQKEFSKAQESCAKLQRDLRENVAQKEDQEERIATLEKRYLHAQRESTSLHDLNEKLEQELRHKEAQLKLHEEKISAIQEKLELSDQKLAQYSKLPEMEEQLKARMEAFNQVGSQVSAVSTKDVLINISSMAKTIQGNNIGQLLSEFVFFFLSVICQDKLIENECFCFSHDFSVLISMSTVLCFFDCDVHRTFSSIEFSKLKRN